LPVRLRGPEADLPTVGYAARQGQEVGHYRRDAIDLNRINGARLAQRGCSEDGREGKNRVHGHDPNENDGESEWSVRLPLAT